VRANESRFAKIVLFLGLAAVFCAGFISTPEVATVGFPNVFFPMLVHTADQSLAVKERRCDFYRHLRQALVMRLEELAERGDPPAHVLVNKERTEFALRKTQAREARVAGDLDLGREKFERAKRLRAQKWTMGWFTCGAEPCSLGPGPGPDDPDWTVVWPNGAGQARTNAAKPKNLDGGAP